MNVAEIIPHLLKIPLFKDLNLQRDKQHLRALAGIVQEANYSPGDRLFGQGEPADRLYLVVRGRIQLTAFGADGSRLDLGIKQPGESFGETGLFVGDFHDAFAEALSPVQVLYITRDDFLPLLKQYPRLQRRLNANPDLQHQRRLPQFDWLREGEVVVHAGQRHVIELVRRALLPALAFIALLMLVFTLARTEPGFGGMVLLSLPALFVGGWLAWDYVDWHDDRFVLTTQRVMHLERKGPFGSMFEEAALDDIQDVLEVKPNVLANLFDYGDIILHTAGGTVKIDFTEVHRSAVWREAILREMGRIQARRVVRMRGETRAQLERRLNLVPQTEPVSRKETSTKSPAPLTVLVSTIRELLFPASWVYGPDNQTIKWRRYWLPGFIRFWWVSLLFLLVTFGGTIWVASRLDSGNWYTVAGWIFLEVLILGVVMWYIEDWRNDFFQITPTHIIHVDRKPLWGRLTRQEARLDRIQNITSDVPDLFARLFNYGKVTLETAGAEGKFEIEYVREPEKVRAEISKRQQQFRQRDLTRQAAQRQDELLSWFAIYDSLRHAQADPDSPDESAMASGETEQA